MLIGYISHYIFGISIFITSLFLIMLVLVQRGRGGGIAGALGGAGGQSAFGTKAGDLFTRITVGVATFWILLCIVAILSLRERAFTTGVDKQQAKSSAVTGAAEDVSAEEVKSAGAGGTAGDGATGPSVDETQTQPSASASNNPQPATADQQATTEQQEPVAPQDSEQPPNSDVSPEVSEIKEDTPVADPE